MLPVTGRSRRTKVTKLMHQLEQYMREHEKMREQERAKREVELFNSQIEVLRTIHTETDDPINWEALMENPPPYDRAKQAVGPREAEAQQALAKFKPSFWDRLLRRTEHKRKELEQRVADARAEDARAYAEWEKLQALAQRVMSGEQEAWLEAIQQMEPFSELEELGSDFAYSFRPDPLANNDTTSLNVEFRIQPAKIIPHEWKKLTRSGKLSVSQMPVTQYYELEQDFVCSFILRVARELFNLLPLHLVYIHVTERRLNTAVGRVEPATLVSVRIERAVLESLHLHAVDPSDALSNFTHRMKFLKTRGFQPIDRIGS